jgi:oligo-1,6-glucosidase
MISKDTKYPQAPITNPKSPYQSAMQYYCNGPRLHEFLHEIRTKVLDKYPDLMTVGEYPCTKEVPKLLETVGPSRRELDMVFTFDINDMDSGPNGKFSSGPWTLTDLKSIISKYQTGLAYPQGWQTVFLESHDTARSVTRFGDSTPQNRPKTAKMLAMLENTLSGTLFMHQGQEIGIANYTADVPISEYADIETRNFLNEILATKPTDEELKEVYKQIRLKARDHGRMPVPWDGDSLNAGFSPDGTVKPWAPVVTDYREWNVKSQDDDKSSVLNFWREMLKFRKENPSVFTYGSFELVDADNEDIFAYKRVGEDVDVGEIVLVVLNFSNKEREWKVQGVEGSPKLEVLKSTTGGAKEVEVGSTVKFGPYEGVVWKAKA